MEMLISLIATECKAVTVQCSNGPISTSEIFQEDVIAEETGVPPGIFIRVVMETLVKAISLQTPISNMNNALHILHTSRNTVLRALLSKCSEPVQKGSFHDPRPVIAETWFLCMNKIAMSAAAQGGLDEHGGMRVEVITVVKELLVETIVAAISLLLYSSLEQTQAKRANHPGMSLDGPHGLVMMDLFVNFFNLGTIMIETAAKELVATIPVLTGHGSDPAGMAIIGAALFRASQGGLPPWTIESVPSVYSSLFKALHKNVDTFGLIFEASMNVRLIQNQRFGSVEGGSLLCGSKHFEKMSGETKRSFIDQAKQCASSDTATSWRRLKTLIKQTCGGKKKDTDFKQRPTLTSWDALDRI